MRDTAVFKLGLSCDLKNNYKKQTNKKKQAPWHVLPQKMTAMKFSFVPQTNHSGNYAWHTDINKPMQTCIQTQIQENWMIQTYAKYLSVTDTC